MIPLLAERSHHYLSFRLYWNIGRAWTGLDGQVRGRAVHVELARKAQRDIRGLDRSVCRSIGDALLHVEAMNADVKNLASQPPWRRLRVGSYRVVFRTLGAEELAALDATDTRGVLVARVVHRRELERAIGPLT